MIIPSVKESIPCCKYYLGTWVHFSSPPELFAPRLWTVSYGAVWAFPNWEEFLLWRTELVAGFHDTRASHQLVAGKHKGSLSNDVFERCTLAGSGFFASLRCDFDHIFGQIVSMKVKKCNYSNFAASRLETVLHGGRVPHERWGNPLRWGNPSVHIISHFNLITFTW